jgi:hypothetical protein
MLGFVLDLVIIGMYLGVFLPEIVLLLGGAPSPYHAPFAGAIEAGAVGLSVSDTSATFSGSACFLLPNNPNNLLFWVFCLFGGCSGGKA